MTTSRLDQLVWETRVRGYCWRTDDVLQRLVEWTQLCSTAELELEYWLKSDYCDSDFRADYPELRN
jgi:hypothetical protein